MRSPPRHAGELGAVRRRSAWLVSLPLVVLGSLVAHQLAYLIVAGHHADALLAETGHGYLEQLPTAAVLGLSCLALGLGLAGFDYVRGARGKAIPAWLTALVPLVGFALQEHLERLAHNGHMPWAAALDATFLVGLGLQLPFAALAFVAARALLRTATAVVAALLKHPQQPPKNRTITRPAPPALVARAAGIAHSLAPRGPPSLSFA
jgi:hypothetical protein